MLTRWIVVAYIVSSDGKLLLGRKDPAKGGVYPDCWHNPGGGVEAGETDEQALEREVREETGLDISEDEVKLIDTAGASQTKKTIPGQGSTLVHMQFYTYLVRLAEPHRTVHVTAGDDLIGFKWFDQTSLRAAKLTPPAIELFERIGMDWLKLQKGTANG